MRFSPALLTLALLLGWPLTRAAAADYTVSTTGNVITVTNTSNHSDTLAVSQPASNTISFATPAAPGRTFSVNGGAIISGNSGNVSLSNVTSIIINGGSGGETFNIGAFGGSSFPSLTINGGVGSDTVNFQGNITFAAKASLTVNLQTSSGSSDVDAINVTGVQLLASGASAIGLECNQSVSITGGGIVQTADGAIILLANQQATHRTGSFTGVNMEGSGTAVKATGLGSVTVSGTGGNGSGGYQLGVNVSGGAILSTKDGDINVTGVGGASTNVANRGVTVDGAGSAITSTGQGQVTVTGTSGTQGSDYGIGVSVINGGQINCTNYVGGIGITGTGGGAGGSNEGVEIGGAGSTITAPSVVQLTGTAGPGASWGLYMDTSSVLSTTAPGSTLGIFSDSISLDSTVSVGGPNASGVGINTISATHINLGGADAAGTLGLSAAELGQMKGPAIVIDGVTNGDMTISAPIAFSGATSLYLLPGSGGLNATASGADLNLDGGTLHFNGALNVPIAGPVADTNFPQLNVTGLVVIGDEVLTPLNLAGTSFGGTLGQQFTIIKNGGGSAISGTFQNLPEGAYLVWPGSTSFAAQITYKGGTSGHDAVLTLVPVAQALNVTSTADDGSPGSLPAVIAFAAAHPGADTITFASSLSGQTINLSGTINIADSAAVTLDASNLAKGLTLQGAGGTFGLIYVSNSQSSLTLRGLTLANGGGSNFIGNGGAIKNYGTLMLIGCTFTGNTCPFSSGGAIFSDAGSVTVLECTFSGNSATEGGAISNLFGPLTVAQSTMSGNRATLTSGLGGGAIYNNDSLTLTNDIIAGNSAPAAPDISNQGSITRSGANVIGNNDSVSGAFPPSLPNANGDYVGTSASPLNPLLATTLGSYGGPTQTLPPLPGSPAIDHGVNSAIPLDPATGLAFSADQRGNGKARISNSAVDIGAVETSALVVTTAADDGTSGSLRQRVIQATDITTTLTFASGLNGSTIPLGNSGTGISLDTNIAIDASALAGGITISGGGASGNFRLFFVPANTTVALRNLTLTGGGGSNFAGQGGAIDNLGAITASQCVFNSNTIAASSGNGGCIYNESAGSMTFNQCSFIANSASGSAAGGAISNDGSMTLNASTLSGNSAPSGGAILNNGMLSLTQCTLAGNSGNGSLPAGQGGAIYSGAGTAGITQCTLSQNSGSDGGAIYNAGGTLTLTNSIAGGNTASPGADIDNHATLVISGADIVPAYAGAAATGSGTIKTLAPLLAPLGNYGGPIQTMALLIGSPARDAAVGSAFTVDQRGFAIADGKPDIGAYEAGDITNFNAWIYENLPASTSGNAAQHAASYDYDGDGVSNYNEWLAQTNPDSSASYLHITQTTLSGKTLSVVFPNVTGRSYTVESSTDLKNWTKIAGPLSAPSGAITSTYTFSIVPPQFFLRASVGAP